jgi:hypothetical protein
VVEQTETREMMDKRIKEQNAEKLEKVKQEKELRAELKK